MLRTFFVSLLFTLKLFSCSTEFSVCYDKARDSKAFFEADSLSVAMQGNSRIIYSPLQPIFKVKRYDPFLGLALIEDKKPFPYPYIFYTKSEKNLVSINAQDFTKGSLLHQQCGLDRLGLFSRPIKTPSLINYNCCALAGIASKKGVINHHYLKHFLESKLKIMAYGDVGIRLKDKKDSLYVHRIDPFFEPQVFVQGDKILAMDGKKIVSLCLLRRHILFASIGSRHTFTILRQGKVLHVKTTVQKRLGGGLLSDTFLERFGLVLNERFCLASISAKSTEMELAIGDCLIQVNFFNIDTVEDIQKYVQKSDIDNALLFQRNDFQFFIHINGKDGKITKKND